MMKSNLDKTFEDYLEGSFWARDWEAGGADPNELKREFPLTLLETPELKIVNQEECRKYALTVIGQYDCKDCKGCNRTKEQVGCDTEDILKNILREIKKFGKFENDEGVELWASILYGKSQGWTYLEESIGDILEDQDMTIFEISRGMPNMIGWSVQFEICDCQETEELDFIYGPKELQNTGVTECKDCP